jgi:hypothetical protein
VSAREYQTHTPRDLEEIVEDTDIPFEGEAPRTGGEMERREQLVAARVEHPIEAAALTVPDMMQQHQMIEDVVRRVMKPGLHYGYIEKEDGTRISRKPMLFKPGMEILCKVFHLRPRYEEMGAIHRENLIGYRIRCVLTHFPSGMEIGEGLGSCNSREKAQKLTLAKRKVEVWDMDNDLLKMACKRALSSAILVSTAASDVFTTDAEKTPGEIHPILNGKATRYDEDHPRKDGIGWQDWTRNYANEKWGVNSRSQLDAEQLWELVEALDEAALPF